MVCKLLALSVYIVTIIPSDYQVNHVAFIVCRFMYMLCAIEISKDV